VSLGWLLHREVPWKGPSQRETVPYTGLCAAAAWDGLPVSRSRVAWDCSLKCQVYPWQGRTHGMRPIAHK